MPAIAATQAHADRRAVPDPIEMDERLMPEIRQRWSEPGAGAQTGAKRSANSGSVTSPDSCRRRNGWRHPHPASRSTARLEASSRNVQSGYASRNEPASGRQPLRDEGDGGRETRHLSRLLAAHVCDRLFEAVQAVAQHRIQRLSGGGQMHLSRCALEELDVQRLLQLADLVADGGR